MTSLPRDRTLRSHEGGVGVENEQGVRDASGRLVRRTGGPYGDEERGSGDPEVLIPDHPASVNL